MLVEQNECFNFTLLISANTTYVLLGLFLNIAMDNKIPRFMKE